MMLGLLKKSVEPTRRRKESSNMRGATMAYTTKILIASSITMMASCVEAPKFPVRTGEDYNITSKNLEECTAEANKFYPKDVQTYTGGGYSTPVSTNCYGGYGGYVSCSTTGGTYIAPYEYDVDVNQSKRIATYHSCLEKKGYELKSIKECSGDRVEIYNEIIKSDQSKQGMYRSETCSITVEGEYMIRW